MPKDREYDENYEDHPDNTVAAVPIITPAAAPIATAPKEQDKNNDDKKYAHNGAYPREMAACASMRNGRSPTLYIRLQLEQRFLG
jgi:hypothetical protein